MPNLANLPVADLQAGTANWSGQGYIDGLKMQWVSATALTVSSGAAFIPALNKCLPVPAAIAKTGLSLTASTWYHVYLWLNAGVPDIEIVTTAPAAAYNGTARAKTGDTSRRYIGSVLTDVGANLINFIHYSYGNISYRSKTSVSPFRVLFGGIATTPAAISLAGIVPPTSRIAYIIPTNQDPSIGVNITSSDSSEPTSEILIQASGASGMSRPPTFMHLDTSQQFLYSYASTPTGSFYVDVWGYIYER